MPYTIILDQACSKQLAELQLLCGQNDIAPPHLVSAAFDKGMDLLTAALNANEAVTFADVRTGAPIEVPDSPFRKIFVDDLLSAARTAGASNENVFAEAFRRGLDGLTTMYVEMVARKKGSSGV
jgi:hypothetical protein